MAVDPVPGYFKGPEPPLIDGVPRWRNRHQGQPGSLRKVSRTSVKTALARQRRYEEKLDRILHEWELWKRENPEKPSLSLEAANEYIETRGTTKRGSL